MAQLQLKPGYRSKLSIKDMQIAIKRLKDFFERSLARQLNLTRISAPLFLLPESGLNDDLNGIERPVSFGIGEQSDKPCQIVQSLAKWKRVALRDYGFNSGEGLYADMNAIRRDEQTDNIHSIYVDQWDWEKVITKKDRCEAYLKQVVEGIFEVFSETEDYINFRYSHLSFKLPGRLTFITSQELLDLYPNLTSKERENAFLKEHKAAFISQIGCKLSNGQIHDGRAPDYDDWSLNGDLLFYNPVLESAFEISSMGIRVDESSLMNQLQERDCLERLRLSYHNDLVNSRLPYTIGGGIGQSRLCMFFLECLHIGEVQASIWTDEMLEQCNKLEINIL